MACTPGQLPRSTLSLAGPNMDSRVCTRGAGSCAESVLLLPEPLPASRLWTRTVCDRFLVKWPTFSKSEPTPKDSPLSAACHPPARFSGTF